MNAQTFLAALALLVTAHNTAAAAPAADTIYVNGRIWTGDGDAPSATALAVSGATIAAVGSGEAIRKLAGPSTRIVDLAGRFVVPGFIDAHTHFLDGALALTRVDLRDAATPAEFSRRIAQAAKANPDRWVLSGDWDHELWGGELPKRDWIDRATGDTPVFVTRLDGHMGLANSAALKLAGIDDRTPDPLGGAIVRDASGRATGLLKDEAMILVARVVPTPGTGEMDEALRGAVAHAVERGVTQIHDMGTIDGLAVYRRARASGLLPIRVYAFTPLPEWSRLAALIAREGRGDDHLRWGGVKGFVDGSLGSTTAWFYRPYTDAPDTSGFMVADPKVLAGQIVDADRAGLHVVVHAIGDHANDWLLDAFSGVQGQNGRRDRRFRIEHAQHLSPAAIKRFRELEVIPSMQPYHAADDGRWAEKRIGKDRLAGTYAFASLMNVGAGVAFGSDWTVAPLSPLLGIEAAITRQTIDGKNQAGWTPAEKISLAQALRAYTANAAFAGFQEGKLGRLAAGYLADFVVLRENLFEIDPTTIGEVPVLRTVIGGREVYVAKPAP